MFTCELPAAAYEVVLLACGTSRAVLVAEMRRKGPALTRLQDSKGVRHARVYQPGRVSGLLLLLAFILNLGGVVMYAAGTEYGWVVETPTYHAWERALFMSSYIAAVFGTGNWSQR